MSVKNSALLWSSCKKLAAKKASRLAAVGKPSEKLAVKFLKTLAIAIVSSTVPVKASESVTTILTSSASSAVISSSIVELSIKLVMVATLLSASVSILITSRAASKPEWSALKLVFNRLIAVSRPRAVNTSCSFACNASSCAAKSSLSIANGVSSSKKLAAICLAALATIRSVKGVILTAPSVFACSA